MGLQVRRDCLAGFRGILSFYIMLHHMILVSPYAYDIMGPMLMPFFFLLSGFSLTLAYGKGNGEINKRDYFQNRGARVLPVYYLALLLLRIVTWSNNTGMLIQASGVTIPNTVLNLLCMNTWWMPFSGSPYIIPSWTLQTLVAFYILFPFTLSRLQSLSDQTVSNSIVVLFYLQTLPYFLHKFIDFDIKSSLMSPLFRFPVFYMGVLAGLLKLRRNEGPYCPAQEKPYIYNILPWPSKRFEGTNDIKKGGASTKSVVQELDCNSAVFVIVALSFRLFIKGVDQMHWYHFLPCHLQLMMICGMAHDKDNSSIIAKICESRLLQFLGRISLPLYLIHFRIQYYIVSVNMIRLGIPDYMYIVVPCAFSVLTASLITLGFEEPARDLLRSRAAGAQSSSVSREEPLPQIEINRLIN